MPPKNSKRLDPGRVYFDTPDGLKSLEGVQAVEITEEHELDITGATPSRIVAPPSEFTASITLTEKASEAMQQCAEVADAALRVFMRVWDVVKKMVDTCPNRRVLYLATHGSPRVRKKNTKRIVRYYKKKQ